MRTTYSPRALALLMATAVGAALVAVLFLFYYSGLASAQVSTAAVLGTTITVNTVDDELNTDEDCSLREAVEAANTNAAVDGCAAGSDTERDAILFAVGQEATITLDSELGVLHITDDAGLTMTGQTNNITVSGNDASQVFEVDPGAVFNLSKLTVADGNFFSGAGLYNNGGTVKVSNSTFSGNSAIAGGGGAGGAGGAIANQGSLTVSNSTFSGNSAAGGVGGGIINFSNGTLTVSNSTFSGNNSHNGGAIRNDGTLTVSNSTFSGNSGAIGGGIFNLGGSLTVSNSTFSGNSAPGGTGGGLYNEGGTLTTVSNSTFSDNSVAGSNSGGGGIYNAFRTLKVSNSTFSGNSAAGGLGGGIYSADTLKVSNSTFSGNSAAGSPGGGGIHVGFSTATLKNTIIANSTQGGDCTKGFSGTIVDRGYNLIEDGSCLTAASSRSGDPMLGALADNGGPTQTMALQEGSKAIDKGNSFGATTDQRGLPRPVDFPLIRNRGDGSDVGAYEVQP